MTTTGVGQDAIGLMRVAYMDTDWDQLEKPWACDERAFYIDSDLLWMAVWVDAEKVTEDEDGEMDGLCTMSAETWDTLGEVGTAATAVTSDMEVMKTGLYFLDYTTGPIAEAVRERLGKGRYVPVDPIAELTRQANALVRLGSSGEGEHREIAIKLGKIRAQLMVAQTRLADVHNVIDVASNFAR